MSTTGRYRMDGAEAAGPADIGENGFDAVYAAESAQVARSAFLLVGSTALAEELVQEAFLRLYQHFPAVTNPGGFLRTVATRPVITRDTAWSPSAAPAAEGPHVRVSRS